MVQPDKIIVTILADAPPPQETDLGRIGTGEGLGPFSNFSLDVSVVGMKLSEILSRILGLLTIIAGLWFFVQLILAGFQYMQSDGDAKKIETANHKITNAVIGLSIVVVGYALVGIIGSIFGLDILNPQKILPNIGPKQ